MLAFIDTPKQISVFTGKICNFQVSARENHAHLLASHAILSMKKKIQCDCQEKNLPFLISREDRYKFSIFSAGDSLI